MNRDVLSYIFFSLSLMFVSTTSLALPFSIVPKAGTQLPTQIQNGQRATAYYTVSNNTLAQRNNNFVKYLPPNTTQITTGGTYGDTCGAAFSLSGKGTAGDSCTLQLSVSGAIDSNDRDPHHQLFVCFPGGVSCAGTRFPLNVTQQQQSALFSYVINFNSFAVSGCPVLNGGGFGACSIVQNGSAPPTAIAISSMYSVAYIADQSNTVSACVINSDGSFGVCTPYAFGFASGLAVNPGSTYLYATLAAFDDVGYCAINSDGTLNMGSCITTGSGFNFPLAIAINGPGTFAYIVNSGTNSISSCTIAINGSLTNCVSNAMPPLTYSVAINPANTYAYVTTSTDVFYCSINLDGTLNPCAVTGSNTFDFPTAITINSAGTFAYVTNFVGNTVSACPINIDGSFGTCSITGSGFDGPNGVALLNG